MDIDRDILIEIYTKMLTIRHFETKLAELYPQGKLYSSHLYVGEEAVACGVCANHLSCLGKV